MRVSTRLCVAALLACAVFAPCAPGSIRVIKANGDAVPVTAYTLAFNAKTGGWDVTLTTLYAPGLDNVFDIRANAGEYINSVVIDVDGPSAGSPVIVKVQGETPGNMLGVGTIVQTGTGETILNKVQVTQDIGSILVEAIGDLIAGRDIYGPITATTANNPLRGITTVQAARDILGDVTADNGRILVVWAQRNIGSQFAPITIRAKHNVYQVMGADVFTNINTRFNGGTGGFWALVANRFSGSLVTEKLIPNPWNGLDGLMEIYNQFDGTITIGKSYNSPTQYIQVPVHGLAGQIIINADNAGGVWTSPVRVGPNGNAQQIVLNNAGYTQTAAAIGGGAVGLVPFRLHDEACSPVNGSSIQRPANAPPLSVELRHYGPVTWTGSVPLTVERRAAGSSGAFAAMSMSNFVVTRSSANRSIILTTAPGQSGFAGNFQYRIRPTTQLRCEVTSTPQAIWDGDYLLTITTTPASCQGDVNQSGAVNVDDLLLVISNWGPVNPNFPAPDINQNGVVNIDDLLAVISHWGACP